MLFKKHTIKKSHNNISRIVTFFTWVWVFILWWLFVHTIHKIQFDVFSFSYIDNISYDSEYNNQENPVKRTFIQKISDIISSDTKEKVQDNTYVLITWKGGWWHEGANLTDSILLAGINYERNIISLLSFPRDLYVDFPGTNNHGKINAVYQHFLYNWHDFAISQLASVIEDITDIEIDYSVSVDFEGFKDIIDTIWGVEITLEEDFVDHRFPNNNFWYQTFILRKWTWNLSGEVALMYARSRYSTSDFDRGLRQQQILSWIQKKVFELCYIRDRKKIVELYNILRDNVTTNIPLTEIVRIGLTLRSWNNIDMLNANYHDNCRRGGVCEKWWFLYTPLRDNFWWQSVLLPWWAFRWKHAVYDAMTQYAQFVFYSPDVFRDPVPIEIYNATSRIWYASSLADKLLPLWFQIDRLTWLHNLQQKNFEKSIIYYNGINRDNDTLNALSDILNIELKQNIDFFQDTHIFIKIVLADFETF